jgi:hypothetical protein
MAIVFVQTFHVQKAFNKSEFALSRLLTSMFIFCLSITQWANHMYAMRTFFFTLALEFWDWLTLTAVFGLELILSVNFVYFMCCDVVRWLAANLQHELHLWIYYMSKFLNTSEFIMINSRQILNLS